MKKDQHFNGYQFIPLVGNYSEQELHDILASLLEKKQELQLDQKGAEQYTNIDGIIGKPSEMVAPQHNLPTKKDVVMIRQSMLRLEERVDKLEGKIQLLLNQLASLSNKASAHAPNDQTMLLLYEHQRQKMNQLEREIERLQKLLKQQLLVQSLNFTIKKTDPDKKENT